MPRPYTDITKAISTNPIKNGSVITGVSSSGSKSTLNTYTKNTPVLEDIQSKYGNRFYNGILVELVGSQTVIGG